MDYFHLIFNRIRFKNYGSKTNGVIFSAFSELLIFSIDSFLSELFFPVTKYFLIFRMLRMLRVFRVFNLLDFMNDGFVIVRALKNSSRKIYIFLLFLIIFSVIVGSMMFMVEGGRPGFETIPQSIYWAVVTVTTVGYGDVSPITPMGKFLQLFLCLPVIPSLLCLQEL